MKIEMELSPEEMKELQDLSGILIRDNEDVVDAIHLVMEKAGSIKVNDAKDFREAIMQ